MIHGFTLETAHLLGDALPAMHRLRHKVFVERQSYDVPTYNGMEWDQFDTPAAVYLLWRDAAGEPRAVARLLPTTRRYMIEELWRDLITSGGIPCQSNIWEATRFGVDRDLEAPRRRRALGELVCGCLEYGLQNGITEYLSVMPLHIIKSVLRGAGVIVNVLGSSKNLGGLAVFAVRIHVTRDGLERARLHYGLDGPVLAMAGGVQTQDTRDGKAPLSPAVVSGKEQSLITFEEGIDGAREKVCSSVPFSAFDRNHATYVPNVYTGSGAAVGASL